MVYPFAIDTVNSLKYIHLLNFMVFVVMQICFLRRMDGIVALFAENPQKGKNRRNGVEGIMSVMRRKYDVDHIPVFGLKRLKTWIWTTLLSYNLVKYQKYRASLQKKADLV